MRVRVAIGLRRQQAHAALHAGLHFEDGLVEVLARSLEAERRESEVATEAVELARAGRVGLVRRLHLFHALEGLRARQHVLPPPLVPARRLQSESDLETHALVAVGQDVLIRRLLRRRPRP